jgi:hypothetical protein
VDKLFAKSAPAEKLTRWIRIFRNLSSLTEIEARPIKEIRLTTRTLKNE